MTFDNVIKNISLETFSEVVNKAPRKVREAMFSYYDIKTKTALSLAKLKEKKEQKLIKLYEKVKEAKSQKEIDFIKELYRNWLLFRREMLKATLDFLNVKNDNGLVDTEIDFFKNLKEEKVKSLVEHLRKNFKDEEILIYLSFVEVPFLEKFFK